MIGLAQLDAGGFDAVDQLVIARVVHLERDVVETADFGGLCRLGLLVDLVVGERKECQRAAVAQTVERVAKRDLAADPMIEVLLAPGRGQRDAENILEELAIFLLIPHDIGMVMQAFRRIGQQFGHGIPPRVAAFTLLRPRRAIKLGQEKRQATRDGAASIALWPGCSRVMAGLDPAISSGTVPR